MPGSKTDEKNYSIGKQRYSIAICDHILDSQYGQIGLTKVEQKIERLPIFKRLHGVSQLGLVNWIFPCALHTRYTHSLGVMHVAGQMAEHINANVGRNFFDEDDIQIIRLAGMLHDIGHYPMSHNVEQVYKKEEKWKKFADDLAVEHLDHYINCPKYLNPVIDQVTRNNATEHDVERKKRADNENDFLKDFAGSKDFHHEKIGCEIITHNADIKMMVKQHFVLMTDPESNEQVLNPKFAPKMKRAKKITEATVEEITDALLTAIGNLVIGNYAYKGKSGYKWPEKYSAMIQLIHSGMDADNLDYLLRDASFSGTSYGIMDMGQLMNCLTIAELKCGSNGDVECAGIPKYLVGIKAKGVGSADQFLINKYLAYTQMTMTKYVSILEAMLSRLAASWVSKDEDYSCEKLREMITGASTSERYLAFTDAYIMKKIYDLDKHEDLLKTLLKAITSRLKNYSAFNLSEKVDSEAICVGFSEDDILTEMKKSSVYQRFSQVCEEIKNETGRVVQNNSSESKMFSFRFEERKLTQQVPLEEFLTRFNLQEMNDMRRFDAHYYRLANGIPVLENDAIYEYTENDDLTPAIQCIPHLLEDCSQSAMRRMHSLRYVSLREYSIKEYTPHAI